MSAALDLALFNIRVNAVGIGPTGAPVGSKDYPERTRKYENPGIPTGHIGEPLDIGHAVSFLVLDKDRYIYVVILPLDGGGHLSR